MQIKGSLFSSHRKKIRWKENDKEKYLFSGKHNSTVEMYNIQNLQYQNCLLLTIWGWKILT
jgi:hypothetical protein